MLSATGYAETFEIPLYGHLWSNKHYVKEDIYLYRRTMMYKRLLIYYPKGTNLSDAKKFLRMYIKDDTAEGILESAVRKYSYQCDFYIREDTTDTFIYGSVYAFNSFVDPNEFKIIKYTQDTNKIMIGEL